MTPIVATDLCLRFGRAPNTVVALDQVSLSVRPGEWVAVMGPSGCGKSSLLNLLGGLGAPDSGTVALAGEAMTGRSESARARLRRRHVGYVFQQYNLVGDLDVVGNVELPLLLGGVARRTARARARSLLEQLGVGDRWRAAPAELSGGQQQRVAVARALIAEPTVVLADEPTGALDSQAASLVVDALATAHRASQTIVMVTHDATVAAAADRVLRLRDGRLLTGPPGRPDASSLTASGGPMMAVVSGLVGAGLRRDRRATALLALVIALAAAGIAASTTVAVGAADRLDEAFAAAGGPDLAVTTESGRAAAISATLATTPDVASVAPPVPARAADMVVDATHTIEHLVAVTGRPGEPTPAGGPVLRSGRMPAGPDEITLDAGLSLHEGIGIGDRVMFTGPDGAGPDGAEPQELGPEFVVVGTAYDFADCFYPTCDPARSWVTEAGMDRLGGATAAVIDVSLSDATAGTQVEERLAAVHGPDAFGANSWPDTRADLLAETDFFAVFLGVFGAFVLAASGVVIAAALTARTVARRRSIGLYKALGVTPAQVTGALVAEHLLVAVVAGTVGWLVAMLLAPRLAVGALRVLGTGRPVLEPASLALTLAVVAAIVALATALPAWRAGRAPVVAALHDAPHSARPRRVLRVLAAARVPAAMELGVRTWMARPFRTAAALVALMLAVVSGVVATSVNHAMDHLLAHPAQLGDPWDALLSGPTAPEDIEASLDGNAAVASWYSIRDSRATVDGERVHLRALGGDPAAARYIVGAGRGLQGPGEALVGYGLLDEHGWQVGDTVDLDLGERVRPAMIVGWYRETEDSGRVIQVRQGPGGPAEDEAPSYAVTAAIGVGPDQLAEALAPLGGRVVVNEPDGSAMRPFRIAMATMSALLAAVALSHLFATSLATARQRAGDVAVLRAVGCTPGQLALGTITAAALSAMVALALGVPLGWAAQRVLGDTITSAVGAGPGASPAPPVAPIVLIGVALVVLAALVETAASLRGRRGQVPRLDRAG